MSITKDLPDALQLLEKPKRFMVLRGGFEKSFPIFFGSDEEMILWLMEKMRDEDIETKAWSGLAKWARDCRPGDVQDGWYDYCWIIALQHEPVNDDGNITGIVFE